MILGVIPMLNRIFATVILVYFIPSAIVLLYSGICLPQQKTQTQTCSEPMLQETQCQEVSVISVPVLDRGKVTQMPLESYLYCVTLAEMPADFEMEALKAQAVVARTYTCKGMESSKHPNGALCTDYRCCQAYITVDAYLQKGGRQESVDKVKRAVDETAGQVLMYQGEYIEATYFSCSGGRTEDAQAVWGNAVPYLQSVESPGEEDATYYTDTVSFTKKDFLHRLSLPFDSVVIGEISYTEGGGVSSVAICGETFSGTEIREKLDLRSTAFVISAVGENVTITTKGFGHRVGLSQYGAEAMAVQGKTYQEILLHYYQGAELSVVSG